MFRFQRWFFSCVIAWTVAACSGCTALVIGSAVGAAGAYVWTQGNLQLNINHSAEDLYAAARETLDELDILVERDNHDRFGANISGRMASGSKVLIKIAGLTEYSAKIRVRVGVLGNLEQSQMIMNLILGKV